MKGYFKSLPFFLSVGILAFVAIIYFVFKEKFVLEYSEESEVKVIKKWDLPRILEEVSGMTYLDNERIACIQDENGVFYIYNLTKKEIEKSITFAERDDYEGVAMVNNTAFILRSDGTIYEISDITIDNPKITELNTPLTHKHDVEGLCYDQKNNRLLLACKNEDPGKDKDYKSVYAFSLNNYKMKEEPIYKIEYDNPIFKDLEAFGKNKAFRTSEINIHPQSGDIYLLDGTISKVLILDQNWKAKSLYVLSPNDFPQPEGITFSPEGRVFISNEGEWNPANILEVELIKASSNVDVEKQK